MKKNNINFDYDKKSRDHLSSGKCSINHTKSSCSMEAVGAIEMFRRSIEKHGLIYNQYLGDGDTSSYKEVVKSNPYEKYSIIPEKLECVGHVQKRLGTRLRNLVKEYKGTLTPLSGKGKLTKKNINSMQNYYGMAIRSNKNAIYSMKKSILAILWHCTEFDDDKYRHQFCPTGSASWCKYKKLETNVTYRPNINFAMWIHLILRPVFLELSSDELLKKCLHGQTQNSNEALNHIIWNKCPKNIYVSRTILELGVYSAILEFNEGSFGVDLVFKQYGILCSQPFFKLSIY